MKTPVAIFSLALVLCGHSPAADAPVVQVETRTASALGLTAMNVSGAIHPHGRATEFYFEYGLTTQYGSATARASLPPRLAAFYRESWDEGMGGWTGGLSGKDLAHHPAGGARGGFVRFSEPSGDDHNHDDGIGTLHLAQYVYPGLMGNLHLGGGEPDLRDAKVSLHVRGNAFVANGAELLWWTQSQSNPEHGFDQPGWRRANWAYTGFTLTDHLRTGRWERVEYRLRNEPSQWSYAGNNRKQQGFERYSYWPINDAQRRMNTDCFHLLAFVNPANPPRGSIDFDEFELVYRNYSLLLPSNGGRLVRSPSDAASLTDGWRNGDGRAWRSAANPTQPIEFVYTFANPVTIRTIQLHQNPDWPAKDVEVLVSRDGNTFEPLLKKQLPEKGIPNANFASTFDTGLSAKAVSLMVRIVSGYKPAHWGLGEIEIFGSGAQYLPEDELNFVNTDIEGLKPGTLYHYRLVAATGESTTRGEDQTFTLPADYKPQVLTGAARRISQTTAQVEGRLNPMGLRTEYYFEFGPDTNYGSRTAANYGGLQITPRSVLALLADLKPGSTIHYRLVGVNATGTSHGGDAQFQTAKK